jgi:VanZ family protein
MIEHNGGYRRNGPENIVSWYWIPAVLWTCVVLGASSDSFSAKHTGAILFAIIQWMFGSIDAHTFNTLHFAIRKAAHFIEYGILSALWLRAWYGIQAGARRVYALLPALAVTLLVAIADEWHQAFVPSRTSSPRDVALDFCGALFAQLVIWIVWRNHQRQYEPQNKSAIWA